MKKAQYNRHNMHLATQSVLNENAAKLETITTYPALKSNIDKSISKEQELACSQLVLKKYTAATKNSARNAAGEFLLDLTSKLSSIAIGKGDMRLLDSVKLTATGIKRSSDNKLVIRMQNVLSCAGENLEALACYGVTPQTLTNGIALCDTYIARIQELAGNKIRLTNLTKQLEQQFRKTLAEIRKVDAIVNAFRLSDPALYSKYWNARAKRNSACTKVSIKGRACEEDTGKGLTGAILTVMQAPTTQSQTTSNKPIKKIRIRSKKGGFRFSLFTSGAYLFKVTYSGCTPYETTVYFNEGVLTHVELPLSKIA